MLARKKIDDNGFDKNKTVFKDWNPPTEKDLANMLIHDREFWKLPRFIKDEKQLKDAEKVFEANLRKLFYVFITVSAGSNFPGITWLDFTKLTERCNIVAGEVRQSDVDRFFLASAGDMASMGCFRY